MAHAMNCNCPRCREAAANFEFEMFEGGELSQEQGELGLALELLSVQNDSELEQFLGDMVRSVGQGLRAAGSFAMKNVVPVLGTALKQVAKAALPIAGGALGSLIPVPGVGTALGSALGSVVANALEMETAGLAPGEADLERARRFIAIARTAIRDAAQTLGSAPPAVIAKSALTNAVMQHVPAARPAVAELEALASRPQASFATPSAMSSPAQSGTWRRHGDHIVVLGL
jgi:hypothetical protein